MLHRPTLTAELARLVSTERGRAEVVVTAKALGYPPGRKWSEFAIHELDSLLRYTVRGADVTAPEFINLDDDSPEGVAFNQSIPY